jgi:hypothetical protein
MWYFGAPDEDEYDGTLDREPMPACCGIEVVSNFGNTETDENFGDHNPTVKVVEASLKKMIKQRREAHFGASAIQVNLNSDQVEKFHKLMLRLGFLPLHTFYHAGHGKEITIYLWCAYEQIRVARKGAA